MRQRLRDIGEARVEIAKIEAGAADVAPAFAPTPMTARRSFVARTLPQVRGGGAARVDHSTAVDLDQLPAFGSDRASELCALDDALNALARMDPRRAQVIELRFFGGLTVEETAGVLQISPQSVLRDWKLARAWLTRELRH